jgi:hypothetical protein
VFDSKDAAVAFLKSSGEKWTWIEESLPVVSVQSCVGPVFRDVPLSEWLPPNRIAPPVLTSDVAASLMQDINQEFQDRTVWPACFLDKDWRFEEIEREAKRLSGHNYVGREYSSLQQVMWMALLDFERVLARKHPDVSALFWASFWRSWQLYRHIMQFCKTELATSIAAGTFPFPWQNPNEAGWFALRQLSSYESEISLATKNARDEPATSPALASTDQPDPTHDFASEDARNRAIAAYTASWRCSEAALARTASVDPGDLSRWKKRLLPAGSDKKARIEKAIRNNERPTPPASRPKDS